jgi:toxin FitB
MSGFLLDATCIAEFARPRPDPHLVQWMQAIDEDLLYLSVLTLGEIRNGIAALPQSLRKARLEAWVELDLPERFSNRVLAIDSRIADRFGRLAGDARRAEKSLGIIEGLLAATAIHHNLTVVSRNVIDFAAAQVPVINPWRG